MPHPLGYGFVSTPILSRDVPDDVRDKALQRTGDTMKKLAEIARAAELPPDQLSVVYEIYKEAIAAAIADKDRAELEKHTTRMPMKIVSCDRVGAPLRIRPKQILEVIERPQTCAYRIEEIAIEGDRSRWRVHGIKVGTRSQLMSWKTPIAGEEFYAGGVMSKIRLETIQTAMDFSLIVEYVGPEEDGEVFEAVAVGTAVV